MESRKKKSRCRKAGAQGDGCRYNKESKDRSQKNLEAFQDVAADVINALYYDGKEVVSESALFPAATETIYVSQEGTLRNQMEDVSKLEIVKEKVKAQYYIANQTVCDKGMVLRKAGYVGAAYREQYDGKMKDTYYPVNEFVLFWGTGHWTAANSLKDFLLEKEADEERIDSEDEMRIKVYEMRHLSPEIRERFRSDMRIVVDYLAEGNSYRSDRKIVHKEALIRMLRALSGDGNVEDTEKILNEMNVKEGDEITVCELFDQYTRKGRQEGREVGRQEGREVGRREGREVGRQEGHTLGDASRLVNCIENAIKNFHITLEEACEGLGTTVKNYEEAKKKIS